MWSHLVLSRLVGFGRYVLWVLWRYSSQNHWFCTISAQDLCKWIASDIYRRCDNWSSPEIQSLLGNNWMLFDLWHLIGWEQVRQIYLSVQFLQNLHFCFFVVKSTKGETYVSQHYICIYTLESRKFLEFHFSSFTNQWTFCNTLSNCWILNNCHVTY